ncbi:MAG TPA: HEAT repeat domain-containing protein [Tepidisphaeraceae bacterium]|jgi:hypothetical protein
MAAVLAPAAMARAESSAFVDTLVRLLNARDYPAWQKHWVCASLADQGAEAKDAVPDLLRAGIVNEELRGDAALALEQISPGCGALLSRALSDNPHVRHGVGEQVAKFLHEKNVDFEPLATRAEREQALANLLVVKRQQMDAAKLLFVEIEQAPLVLARKAAGHGDQKETVVVAPPPRADPYYSITTFSGIDVLRGGMPALGRQLHTLRLVAIQVAVLKDPDADSAAKTSAGYVLRELGPAAVSAIPQLVRIALCDDNTSPIADAAIRRIVPDAGNMLDRLQYIDVSYGVPNLNNLRSDLRMALIPGVVLNLRQGRNVEQSLAILEKIGPAGHVALPALLRSSVRDPMWPERLAAILAVRTADDIEPLLENIDPVVRICAVRCLYQSFRASPYLAKHMQALLEDKDVAVRREASAALENMVSREEFIAALVKACQSADAGVATDAARRLVNLGPSPQVAVSALIEQLNGPPDSRRRVALDLLPRYGKAVAPAAPALVRLIENGEPAERAGAVVALSVTGEPARNSVSLLKPFLKSEEHKLQEAALTAIANIGPPAADLAPQVVPLLTDKEKQTRALAAGALAAAAPDSPELVDALLASIERRDFTVRARLAKGVAHPDAHPELIAKLKTFATGGDRVLAFAASQTLKELKQPPASTQAVSAAAP